MKESVIGAMCHLPSTKAYFLQYYIAHYLFSEHFSLCVISSSEQCWLYIVYFWRTVK